MKIIFEKGDVVLRSVLLTKGPVDEKGTIKAGVFMDVVGVMYDDTTDELARCMVISRLKPHVEAGLPPKYEERISCKDFVGNEFKNASGTDYKYVLTDAQKPSAPMMDQYIEFLASQGVDMTAPLI